MGIIILFLCSNCGLGVREAIACAESRIPCCWLAELWAEEEE